MYIYEFDVSKLSVRVERSESEYVPDAVIIEGKTKDNATVYLRCTVPSDCVINIANIGTLIEESGE
jgi:hypothetical protein